MNKIFISYSSNDKPWVSKLANELINQGYDVWWDLKLLPGQKFEEVIRAALSDAKCVVTVWSESSLQSVWVQEESSKALERGILIPVLYQNVIPPMPFGRIHTGDLTKWSGKADDPAFQQLLQSIDLHSERTVKTTPYRSKKKTSIKLISFFTLLFVIISIVAFNFYFKVSDTSIFFNIFNEKVEEEEVKEKYLSIKKSKKDIVKETQVNDMITAYKNTDNNKSNSYATQKKEIKRIKGFDIKGAKLGMSSEDVINKIHCNYSKLREWKKNGDIAYFTMDCRKYFTHDSPEELSYEYTYYSFDKNKKLINLSRNIRYGLATEAPPNWEKIESEIISKYGQPDIKGRFSYEFSKNNIGSNVSYCWGSCYLNKGSRKNYAVGKSKGTFLSISHDVQAVEKEGEKTYYHSLYFSLRNSETYLKVIRGTEKKHKKQNKLDL